MKKKKFESFSEDLVGVLLKEMKEIHWFKHRSLPDYMTLKLESDNTFICGENGMSLKMNLPPEQQRDYELFRTNVETLQKQYAGKKTLARELLSSEEFVTMRKIVFNLHTYSDNARVVATRDKESNF
ncbi:MAG: hypothetical protein KKF46_02890 [Nanoarchaeota archaeon]|nr:hypothetical protein [Nanoarchaeota archaeon]MBU1321279.1 hypothetical protein [Nanoarchaeota archaeon]MBU1597109.1 hypothetical protein [Nanoarchaeota archaeon]MBU2442148.1 hypothetical protein [Nanoarchaeota archaeon]